MESFASTVKRSYNRIFKRKKEIENETEKDMINEINVLEGKIKNKPNEDIEIKLENGFFSDSISLGMGCRHYCRQTL